MQSRQTNIESHRVFFPRPAQINMSEEKEDQKTKKLGIVALATAVLSWGCMLGYIPGGIFAFFPSPLLYPPSLPFLAERLRWAR